MQPLEIALLGAGGRGTFAYGRYAELNPHLVRFVAVAEPNEERRERFRALHGIPAERCFASWEELLSRATTGRSAAERDHGPHARRSTLAALDGGYQVLLEKPMAVTPEECVRLVLAAEERGRILQICHVLRYTQFWAKLHEIVQSGRLGPGDQCRPSRERGLLAHGPQLCARQLAVGRRELAHDPGQVLP
jgi:predicted dehydrogenase